MNNWDAIKYVSSGVTLVAFVFAVVAAAVNQWSRRTERLINTAPKNKRAELVARTLEFFEVDTAGMSEDARVKLAMEQIRQRARRSQLFAIVVIAIAIIGATVLLEAIRKAHAESMTAMFGAQLTFENLEFNGAEWEVSASIYNSGDVPFEVLSIDSVVVVSNRITGPPESALRHITVAPNEKTHIRDTVTGLFASFQAAVNKSTEVVKSGAAREFSLRFTWRVHDIEFNQYEAFAEVFARMNSDGSIDVIHVSPADHFRPLAEKLLQNAKQSNEELNDLRRIPTSRNSEDFNVVGILLRPRGSSLVLVTPPDATPPNKIFYIYENERAEWMGSSHAEAVRLARSEGGFEIVIEDPNDPKELTPSANSPDRSSKDHR